MKSLKVGQQSLVVESYSKRYHISLVQQNEEDFGNIYHACICAQLLSPVNLFVTEPMDSDSRGSSVQGIFKASISYSRGSSWPSGQAHVSCILAFGRQILYCWVTWEVPNIYHSFVIINSESKMLILENYPYTKVKIWFIDKVNQSSIYTKVKKQLKCSLICN